MSANAAYRYRRHSNKGVIVLTTPFCIYIISFIVDFIIFSIEFLTSYTNT